MPRGRIECTDSGGDGKCLLEFVSVPTCCMPGCQDDIDFIIPADLCRKHWEQWCNFELDESLLPPEETPINGIRY